MISFSLPTTIDPKAQKWPLSYAEEGATRGQFPAGFVHDSNEIYIGSGEAAWQSAIKALKAWEHYPSSWTKVKTPTQKIIPGLIAAVYFKLFGLWWTNYCRVIYVNAEKNEWGFAYGTLVRHVECGEEYFYLRRDDVGKIYYGIKAFSKPNYWFVWLGYPLARFFQKRFVRQSLRIMQNKIKSIPNEK